jgi:hypothetical protein
MARTVSKLSSATVKNASQRGYYSDGGGLYLQVGATGSKSWVFRYKVGGKLHEMGLGALHTVGQSLTSGGPSRATSMLIAPSRSKGPATGST